MQPRVRVWPLAVLIGHNAEMRCVHQLHAVNFPVERPPAILDVAFIVLSTLLIIIDILFEMMHDHLGWSLRSSEHRGRVVTHESERGERGRPAPPPPAPR